MRRKKTLTFVISMLLIAAISLGLVACGSADKWPTTGLGAMLPEPKSKSIEIGIDSDSAFSAEVNNTDSDAFKSYVDACKQKGFTEGASASTGLVFSAFNNEDYQLKIIFSESNKTMSVQLSAPVSMGEITWPTTGLATKLPNPETSYGKIKGDSSSSFLAYIGKCSKDQFNRYAEACKEKGFTENYMSGDNSFSAKNSEGDSLHLTYGEKGKEVMTIYITAASKSSTVSEISKEESSKQESSKQESSEQTSSAANKEDASFRQLMKEYEEFADEYVAFMKKYKEGGNPVEMATEFAEMTNKKIEWANKISQIDKDSLSKADQEYLAQVLKRVADKYREAI